MGVTEAAVHTAAATFRGIDGVNHAAEPTGLPPVPPRLTVEERLSLENLALKAENLRLQQERLKQDFLTATKMLGALQKEVHEYQMGLDSKYGVKLAECTIQSDGSIVPKTGNPMALNGG